MRAFSAAGLVEQEAGLAVFEPPVALVVEQDEAFLEAGAAPRGIDGELHARLRRALRRATGVDAGADPRDVLRELAPARTFALREEVQDFLARVSAGATPENVVIVEEDGSSAQPLRFPDECVRHKIVDLLGDLSLLGVWLGGRLIRAAPSTPPT